MDVMLEGTQEQYSTFTGFIYIFNIIVGTGALTIPGAFGRAGWGLGLVLVILVAFAGYMTVTFVVETLSVVNAIQNNKNNIQQQGDNLDDEDTPLVADEQHSQNVFNINNKYELGEMATLLLSKPFRVIVYICLTVYLFGDLAIYCAVVATTLSKVTCTYRPVNITCNMTIPDNELCWDNISLTRVDTHRIYITLFVLLLAPFTFFNVQKTKFLQLLTSLMRWSAFVIMISWSVQKLITNGVQGNTHLANPYMIPSLFGASVYSFMCHHSVPSLIHPLKNKHKLSALVTADYVSITLFYIVLAITGVFTFKHVDTLYTLNFWPDDCDYTHTSMFTLYLSYFLALFPVFALSTSYPIIAITLRNNLKYFFHKQDESLLTRILFPLVTIIPPTIISIIVTDLQVLVGVIGSYAGAAVQYLIPCILVTAARYKLTYNKQTNFLASPFTSKYWVYGIYIWMLLCLVFITINYVK